MNNSQQTGGEEFYSALQEKAQAAVASIFKSPLYPIQYPSQGDFMWNWQNTNQVFNESTFNYINARLSPGDIVNTAKLGSAGSFPNAYVQVLNSINYTLNTADAEKVQTAQSNASQQITTVVSNYQTTFGTITQAQMDEVGVSNKWDYIVGYVLGSVWSGKAAAGESPLTYTAMSEARNLKRLMPDMPASGDQTLTDVSLYLNLMGGVTAFLDSVQYGTWVLTSLKNNSEYPSVGNDGMKTVNPNTGAISDDYNVGYGINYPTSSISNDLQNTGRSIEVSMETSSASGSTMNVSVEGQAGFSIGSWLKFSVSGGASYDMSKTEGTSEDCSVTMKWEGYSMIPTAPTAWQQATDKGWYFADPIKQALDTQGQDVSGFSFVIQPPFNMGKFTNGGDFGMLNNILIANYPTIEITYRNANFSEFEQSWGEYASGNLTLFGFIKLGSFSEGVYQSSYERGADNSSFTVRFSASSQVVGVPELQKTSYVIGGAITNPGT